MVEKMALLLILWICMLAYDGRRLKKLGRGAGIAYGLLIAAALYLSMDYLLEPQLPNLDEAVKFVLGDPVKRIVSVLGRNIP